MATTHYVHDLCLSTEKAEENMKRKKLLFLKTDTPIEETRKGEAPRH